MAHKNNNESTETIIALATPPGSGALAIVRISGVHALKALKTAFVPIKQSTLQPRVLTLGWVVIHNKKLDQAMAVYMPNPNSFTGEDVVEIHLHGSTAVIQTLLNEIADLDFVRPAEPGEFTKRAFLNGKIDLLQAEAIAELIASKNQRAATSASYNLNGKLSEVIKACKQDILSLSAYYVANLDFSEEDVESLQPRQAKRVLEDTKNKLEMVLQNAQHQSITRDGLKVALVGLPNAGKSTLLNMLLGYERAIVTPIAGTTRDVLSETIQIDGLQCIITDTAGLRSSKNNIEKLGIERTKQEVKASDYNLVLIEPGKQEATHKYLVGKKLTSVSSENTIIVFTKSDCSKQQPTKFFTGYKTISISNKDPKSVQKVVMALKKLIKNLDIDSAQLLTLRQENLLKSVIAQLQRTIKSINSNTTDDIVLVELQTLIELCNALTGEHTTEAMLTEVFSNFCIGK
jgi:tRNA modification GTPase